MMSGRIRLIALVAGALTLIALARGAAYQPDAMVRSVMSGGGGAAAPTFAQGGAKTTVAQPGPVGIATGSGLILYSGYWAPLHPASAVDLPEPLRTELLASSPNPFNPSTSIAFTLDRPGRVRLDVFDVRGRLVRRLVDGPLPAGRHAAVWQGTGDDGQSVSSGVYFYRLSAGDYEAVRKMTLVK